MGVLLHKRLHGLLPESVPLEVYFRAPYSYVYKQSRVDWYTQTQKRRYVSDIRFKLHSIYRNEVLRTVRLGNTNGYQSGLSSGYPKIDMMIKGVQ